MPLPTAAGRRHFEDLVLGEIIPLGPLTVTREMILDYAREFDPLPFHLDEEAARKSLLGGLAASGWQTGGLSLGMLVENFLGGVASAGGLGFEALKWKNPVMAGDTIAGTATISGLRRSASRPQWGIVTIDFDVRGPGDRQVLSMRLSNLVECREPAPAEAGS